MPRRPSSIEYRKNLKDKILEVSIDMFRSHGLKAVKMDDIARQLTISKRTLYEIYPKKEDLVYEALKASAEKRRADMKRSLEQYSDIMDAFTEYLRCHINSVKNTNPVLMEDIESYPSVKAFYLSLEEEHAHNSADFYRRGQEEGYFIPNINISIMKEITKATSDYIGTNMLYKKYSPGELLHAIIIMFVRSICTEAGRKRIDDMLDSI